MKDKQSFDFEAFKKRQPAGSKKGETQPVEKPAIYRMYAFRIDEIALLH